MAKGEEDMMLFKKAELARKKRLHEDASEVTAKLLLESIGIMIISLVLIILIIVGAVSSVTSLETSWLFRLRAMFLAMSFIPQILLFIGFLILPGTKLFLPALALPVWLGFAMLFFLLRWLKDHMQRHVLISRICIIVLLVCMGLGYYFFILPNFMTLPHPLSFD
jgi:hypothetical protein